MLEGEFRLTSSERTELRDRMRSRTLPAEDVRRARLIVLLAQGKSYLAIRQVLGCNPTISVAGRVVSKPSGWRACTPTTADERWRNEPRRWRPGFWSGPAGRRRMAPRTGAAASWPNTWASAT